MRLKTVIYRIPFTAIQYDGTEECLKELDRLADGDAYLEQDGSVTLRMDDRYSIEQNVTLGDWVVFTTEGEDVFDSESKMLESYKEV